MQNLDKYIIENIGDYEQKGKIGEGASGNVYIYTNKKTHKKYAGKVLENFKEKDFFREIQIQLIDHPAILKLQGFKATTPAIILTEYMENGSLDKKIKDKALNNTQKQIILYGIAKGIEYLHSKQIFHRDLKPGNILLDDNLYPKISDFGLSKFTDSSTEKRQSRICGTPKYYAPEVLTGVYSNNADIFSFGVILYEVITDDIKNKKIDLHNDKLPKQYRDLIEKCTEAVYENRPNIREIVRFLSNHLLDNINKQEFDDYAMIVDKFKPEGRNINQANDAYEKALKFIEEKNFIKAGKFFEISAENGNSDAMFRYSQLLFDGKGVPQDIQKSFYYLKKAADDNNNTDAQYKLAFIYLDLCEGKKQFEDIQEGEGTPEYYIKEAAKYMRLVADSGNPQAQYKYSLMLSTGYGVHQDESKSLKYLEMAATNKNPDVNALIELGKEFLTKNNISSAEKYFQTAADLNSPEGQYYYGMMKLKNCKKKSENAKNAAEYIQKAAENDDENNSAQKLAQNLYGVCLYEGIGMKKNEKEAVQYFEKAASKEYSPAIFNIGLIQEKKIYSQISKKMNQSQLMQTNAGSSPISSPKSQPTATLKSKSSMQCFLMEKDQMKKFEEPLENFKNAADLGCLEAADYYATLNNDNIRIKEEYFKKAAKEGNKHAQYMLFDLYCDIQDKKNMNKYLQLAASQKYMPALIMLAEQNEKNGKIKDAIKYYQMVADQDFNQEKDRNIEIISAYYDAMKFNEKNKNDAILASLEKLAILLRNENPELAKIYAEKGNQLGSIPCKIEYAKLTNNIEMMKEVADTNDKNAQYEYAKLIFKPERVDECIKYLTNAAEQHNDAACMELVSLYGRCNLFGEKTAKYKDMKKSKYFCQIAAEDNYPQALTKLGLDYLCGIGCKKDIQKAKDFFKKAIDEGNDEIALFNYADILMKERNDTNNASKKNELYKEAFNYYKESAKQNSPQGQFRYACIVLEILQKKESDELNNELTDSQNDDFNDENEINYKTVEKYLKSSAKQNYPPAFLKFSDYLLDKKDTKTALKYLKKAADKDDKAKFKYGKILYDGYTYIKDKEEVFSQDQKTGLAYIKQAAENKFKEAEEFLESIKGKSESSSKMLPEKK